MICRPELCPEDPFLGLLSVHSDTSREFTLEDVEATAQDNLIQASADEIMLFQKQHA